MRINISQLLSALIVILTITSCAPTKEVTRTSDWQSTYNYSTMDEITRETHIAVEKYLLDMLSGKVTGRRTLNSSVRIDSVNVSSADSLISVTFNSAYSDFPIRPSTIALADSVIRNYLPEPVSGFQMDFFSMGYSFQDLIPQYYLRDQDLKGDRIVIRQDNQQGRNSGTVSQSPSFETTAIDGSDSVKVEFSRLPTVDPAEGFEWVRNLDRPWSAPKGLDSRQVAMWHSHGWYFNPRLDRWEWQRPRLFGTVEDMLPMAFVIPYIVPMLENAGAYVWLPRERDPQSNEVVIDNDRDLLSFSEVETSAVQNIYTEVSISRDGGWSTGSGKGFNRPVRPLRGNQNPFLDGTFRVTMSDTAETTVARWVPVIPESGDYAVYISYAATDSSVTDAHYRVYHAGGETNFAVNQRVGGGTWIYLGHFRFEQGGEAAVELSNRSRVGGLVVSADGIRFGGGTGIVERGGRTSGRPRFMEGARYNLQYSGIPDTLVWQLNENNDYNDDFQSRGEWVNYLRGAPSGPNRDREVGLGLPIDLSVAFHTDAGVTLDDRIVGTLAIYSAPDMNFSYGFPSGQSRLANRDLTDLMQTQIVNDIRARFDTTWVRRRLMNSRYSEAARPNVPAVLLELLSHQNFRDMEYAMDPRFRFEVSRAIYKSILRFIASQYDRDYVIQPLPVTNLMSAFEGNGVRLSWSAVEDPLEPTADPDRYILYTRIEDGGFDNGMPVSDTTLALNNIEPGVMYSFMVRAANDGGVSMPSEEISVLHQGSNETVLIVNGFTRVSAPKIIKEGDFRGFAHFMDAGVPDRYDIGHVGEQINFNVWDEWIENDNPGHGMSHADLETVVFAGNTFDFASVHGDAIRENGLNFVTVSEAAVESGLVDGSQYRLVDLILGNQRQVDNQSAFADSIVGYRFGIYGPGMQSLLEEVTSSGGGVFVSGAHVGTDLLHRPQPDSLVGLFAREVLKYDFTANHASRTGSVIWPTSGVGGARDGAHAGGGNVAGGGGDGAHAGGGNVAGGGARDGAHAGGGNVAGGGGDGAHAGGTQGVNFMRRVMNFNTQPHPTIYRVDAPDAIKPIGDQAKTWLRYAENEFSAGVRYEGDYRVVVLGFPFETVMDELDRRELMREVLRFLRKN